MLNVSRGLFFVLFVCFLPGSCNNNAGKKQLPAVKKDTAEKVHASVKPLDTGFGYFLGLFRKVELPYEFDDDSIQADQWHYTDSGSRYSGGLTLDEKIIPRPLFQKWVLDSRDTLANHGLRWFLRDIDVFYNHDEWYTIMPFIRIYSGNRHGLVLKIYIQISATNGGFTDIWSLCYNDSGTLVTTKKLGVLGCESHKTWDGDPGVFRQETVDCKHLKVKMKTLSDVKVTQKDTRDIETYNGKKSSFSRRTTKLASRKISLD
jgi:hypothetical protein